MKLQKGGASHPSYSLNISTIDSNASYTASSQYSSQFQPAYAVYGSGIGWIPVNTRDSWWKASYSKRFLIYTILWAWTHSGNASFSGTWTITFEYSDDDINYKVVPGSENTTLTYRNECNSQRCFMADIKARYIKMIMSTPNPTVASGCKITIFGEEC